MTIREILEMGSSILKDAGIEDYSLESQILLSHHLNVQRLYLLVNLDKNIDQEDVDKIKKSFEERKNQKPISYITGDKNFYGRDFEVLEGVLIPRFDTELLVELALKKIKILNTNAKKEKKLAKNDFKSILKKTAEDMANARGEVFYSGFDQSEKQVWIRGDEAYTYGDVKVEDEKIRGLEVGAGTGIISITLALEDETISMTSCDISETAIKNAKINAEKFEVSDRVNIIESDVYESFERDEEFDFIISNPPYIKSRVIEELDEQIKSYEPILALDGGGDGLYYYRRLTDNLPLKSGGFIAVEIGYDQGEEVKNLFENAGLIDVQIYKDLSGLDRVVIGQKV